MEIWSDTVLVVYEVAEEGLSSESRMRIKIQPKNPDEMDGILDRLEDIVSEEEVLVTARELDGSRIVGTDDKGIKATRQRVFFLTPLTDKGKVNVRALVEDLSEDYDLRRR